MPTVCYTHLEVLDAASPWLGQKVDVRVDGASATVALAGTLPPVPGETTTDCTRQGLTTGFVDLGAESPFPGHPQRGSLASWAQEAYLGGFAAVAVQPQTDPPLATPEALASLYAAAKGLPITLYAWASISQGNKGTALAELARLHTAGAIGYTDGPAGTPTEEVLRLALCYNRTLPLWVDPYTLAPQAVRTGAVGNESAATVALGLTTAPAEWEAEALRKLSDWAAYEAGTTARLVVGPITTEAGLAALPAGASALTAPHYLLLADDQLAGFDPRFKVFPPLRASTDVAALVHAVVAEKIHGIATAHIPLTLEEKHHDFTSARAGTPALHSAFSVLVTALVQPGFLSLQQLVALLQGGYRVLGLPAPVLDANYKGPLFRLDVQSPYTPYRPTPIYALADPYDQLPLRGTVTPLLPLPA